MRGRPRTFDRDAALEAAMLLFWRKGYTASSIADLCEVMGIASPSLYAAFGSKEALYEEALQLYGRKAEPGIWQSMFEADTAKESIEGFLVASAKAFSARGMPGGCMVALSTVGEEGNAHLGRIVAESRASAITALEERLKRSIRDGELPKKLDVTAIARFYVSVQQGMAIQSRDHATRDELIRIARTAMAAWPALTE